MRKRKTTNIIFDKIKQHIYENINLYIIVSIFFLIGIIGGVIFSNNLDTNIQESINSYISEFISSLKNDYEIDYSNLLKQTIINQILFTLIIWFMGCTVIGIPIVYGMIAWKGFSLSYSIASIIINVGTGRGIILCILSMLLQNIISIPAILALGVSGNRLYKSIIKNKQRENIKIEIVRHTLFCGMMLILLIISALIEVYISSYLTQIYIENL